MSPSNNRPLLTPKETADQLNASTKTVYRLIKAGKLRAIRFERTLRIAPEDLDAFLQNSRI